MNRAQQSSSYQPWGILIILFLSGIAGLTYEVIWLRQLHLIFGVTAYALAVVLGAFMAGLALGGYAFGKIADTRDNPLLLYAILEGGIGLFALLSPLIFSGLENVYVSLGREFGSGSIWVQLFRFFGAFIVILIPTTLMGGTLPIISRAVVRKQARLGLGVGLLYGVNTFGAVVGTFLTGFFLIRWYGMWQTTLIAATVNAVAALAAAWLSMRLKPVKPTVQATSTPKTMGVLDSNARVILAAIAISGFAALAYEILWTRSLVYFLGLSTYAFATMLTTFLIGLAAGSLIISRFVDRIHHPLFWFAVLELAIGILAVAMVPALRALYPLSNTLSEIFSPNTWWGMTGIRFALAMVIMLPATLCMGALLPLAIRAYTRRLATLGRGFGEVYAANTSGSIAGSLAAGFIIIPLVGLGAGISLTALLNLAVGGFLLWRSAIQQIAFKRAAWAGFGVGVLAVVLFTDTRPLILSAAEFVGDQQRYNLLWAKEGTDASLAVLEDKITHQRELNINGESTAFTIYQDMQVHKLLGHLPPLLHPDPRDFLVVGFGLGSTAYAASLYDGAQVDIVELVADEIETAPFFQEQNHGVLGFDNVQLLIGDGREEIKHSMQTYDVISFNAIHPKISPALYTLEFYEYCKRLLREDGMIIAWMPPNALTAAEFWSLLRTFQTALPHSSLWYVNPSHFLILGSVKPLEIHWGSFLSHLQNPKIAADLRETNYDNPYEILSNFFVAEQALAALVQEAPLNTDNHPVIEFSQVHQVSVNLEAILKLQEVRQSIFHEVPVDFSGYDAVAIRDSLERYYLTKTWVMQGQVNAWLGRYTDAQRHYETALEILPENLNAQYLLELLEGRASELAKLLQLNPRNVQAMKALAEISLERGNTIRATELLEAALRLDPGYADAYHILGIIKFREEDSNAALKNLLKAIQLDPEIASAHYFIGQVYWRMGKAREASNAFGKAAAIDPAQADHHFWLGVSLLKRGMSGRAREALYKALAADPDYEAARDLLDRLTAR